MASTADTAHLPALGSHVRDEAGRQLQATLVDLVDLSLVGKQLHWTIVGPTFHDLHLRLDTLVESWRDLSDKVAERAVALGYFPDGQADTVAGTGDRSPLEAGPVDDLTVLRELARRIAETAERARARLERVGELDLVSQDLLIGVVGELEEQLWMTRAQLGHRD
jgi:starvation-inducible DNA-binding protein